MTGKEKSKVTKPSLAKVNKIVKLHPHRKWLHGVLDYHLQNTPKRKKIIILSEGEDGTVNFSELNVSKRDKVFMYTAALQAEMGGYRVE